jgi:hypothetical protein
VPLAEMMKLLIEAKEYIPVIKVMPEKIHNVELEIYELKDQMRTNYVTYFQLKATHDIFRQDLETLMDHTNQQTIKKVI